jgi:hypothetical protein
MFRARLLTRRLINAAAAFSVLLCAGAAGGASLFDPALTFRVIRTEHFRIYFHKGEERLAARLSAIAEDAWHALERPLGTRPPALTHIVLADQTEQANGYATPLPYDTIVIYPTWPRASEFNTDDWLRLVITHEFTHIVHLDRSESWARVVRGIFGRAPIAFPNIFLPTWQIEGLATYEESAITGEGRLHAGDFRVITEEAGRQHSLEPIDRVNGGLTAWPSGQAPYAYGVGFHQYLADRFGADKLAELAQRTARRVPYTASPVFHSVFGQSLGVLWNDYEQSVAAGAGPQALDAGITRLTNHGFVAAAPRFDADGSIVYAKRTPDEFPTLERIDADGKKTKTLATRYFGSTTGLGDRVIYFDQLEIRRNVALLSDLYALDRESGRVRRVPGSRRLRDPDVSRGGPGPSGGSIVATREGAGRRELVQLDAARFQDDSEQLPTVLRSEADTQFNAPRWSPDRTRIAVERHRLGFDPEIVVLDTRSNDLSVVAAAAATRIVMPAWRPDGRAIVAAVARDDEVFNLYEFPVDAPGAPRQLTHSASGAMWPDVSHDGSTIVFVGYSTAGYDLFSMPYPAGVDARPLPSPLTRSTAATSEARDGASAAYSPLGTLWPRSWTPIVEWDSDQVRIGATVSGRDVLGYHWYTASATWLAASPDNAPTPNSASPDWFVSYTYDRWRPALFAAASLETSFFAGPATDRGLPSATTRRELQIQAGVLLPVLKARTSHTALATLVRSVDDYTQVDRLFSRERTAIRTGWRSNTARTYGYSISPENGITAGATGEFVRRALGASADATIATADARAFLPGIRLHDVIALRAAGGVSSGDPVVGRTFLLGGAGPDPSVIDFGNSAISLLRGFAPDSFAGSRVALLNGEYRFPLARPQRGYGTWPFFLHTLHAAAFVDAGTAWTRAFDAGTIRTSVGGELSANLIAGFYFPFTATAGVAWGHDGGGTIRDSAIAYFRVGKSF